MKNRKIGRKPDRRIPAPDVKMNRTTRRKLLAAIAEPQRTQGAYSAPSSEGSGAEIRAVKPEEPETQKAQKGGTIILTGLKLEAEDGSGRSLELARCLDQWGYGAFFVDPGASRRASRTAYCPHCQRRHNALRFIDAVDEGWPVLDEENDCILSPETLISGVIQLLKKAAPSKAVTS